MLSHRCLVGFGEKVSGKIWGFFCPVFDAKNLTLIRTKKCNDVTFLYSKVT
jgi:hypothetical protein